MSLSCRKCGHQKSKVVLNRSKDRYIRRSRKCVSCGHRFNTYEREAVNHNPKNPNEAQAYEKDVQRRFRFIEWVEGAEHRELDDLINFVQAKYKPRGVEPECLR